MSLTQLLSYTSDGFPPFKDEADYLTISYKRRVLSDWTIFICGGFKKMLFTPTLYRFLINHCIFLPLLDQESFWKYYFNSDVFHLRVFLNQFGGNLLSAGFATISWLGGPGSDLKGAMCLEMYPIYPALTA